MAKKECKQCGSCCKFISFPSSAAFEAESAKDWLKIRGIKAEDGKLKIDIPCPRLTADGKCEIQDNKPEVCKNFEPGSIPECPLYDGNGGKNIMENIIQVKDKSFEEHLKEYRAARSKEGVLAYKELPIFDLKVETTEDGLVVVEGYANTKNQADRYGDIPTVFSELRNYVYELEDFHKNPVALMNHENGVENIVGSFSESVGGYALEDEMGLKVKLVFTNSNYGPVAHARTVYAEGHGRAFSIGGRWYFEDSENPEHLTYAKIFEISIVGVGADPSALARKGLNLQQEDEKATARNLQGCIAAYEGSIKAGRVLSPEDLNALRLAREMLGKICGEAISDEDRNLEIICQSIK